MALRMASSESGMAPFWNATPSRKALVAMLSPSRAEAMPVASMISRFLWPMASRRAPCVHLEIDIGIDHEACGRLQVGIDDGLRRAAFDAAHRRRVGGHHDVATENEVGAARGDADGRNIFRRGRDADMAHHRAVFCESPVKSSAEQPRPSRWAAIPKSAPMVMTPVPPMPVTRML
jgi:hypothetical protein